MVKSGLKSILRKSLGGALGGVYRGAASCLMYHRIAPSGFCPSDFSPNLELFVRVEEFEKQMDFISRNYRCISLDLAIQELKNSTLKPGSVVVTFDDGHLDNILLGLPILRKYKIPATLYITSGLVDGSCRLWWYDLEQIISKAQHLTAETDGRFMNYSVRTADEKKSAFQELAQLFKSLNPQAQSKILMLLAQSGGVPEITQRDSEAMTWEQLHSLKTEPLITIGGHSVNHPVLSRITAPELEYEVTDCKSTLERQLQRKIEHFAYPFGDADQAADREFQCAERAGYLSAMTTRQGHLRAGHRERLFSLPRLPIGYRDTLENFHWKLSGLDTLIQRPGSLFVYD